MEVHVNYNIAVQKDLTEDEALPVPHKSLDKEVSIVEASGVKDRVENPISSENVHSSLGKHTI